MESSDKFTWKILVDDDRDLNVDVTWNDRIAFVHLSDGCYLIGYEGHEMSGKKIYFVKEPHYLQNHEWAYVIQYGGNIGIYTNFISGYWCRCTK